MLEERKAAILKAVVQEYIQTAQPVGSTSVSGAPGIEVSSATVRNEMLQLERQGYLHQPHTSAGRVPTEKGYRFFVDALGSTDLDANQHVQVSEFFHHSHGELERLLHETTGLLVDLTHYAAVVVGPGAKSANVRSIQLVSVSARVALVVVVLSNGAVEKATVDLDEAHDEATVEAASAALNGAFLGHPLDEPVAAPDAGLSPAAVELFSRSRAAIAQLADVDPDHVFVGGTSQMASAFDAVQTVQRVLSILEQQLVVVSLLRDVLDRGQSVAIGTETGVQPLADCSLIVAPYTVDGGSVGTIGVLGPTRMNYPQALSAVAVVSQALGDRLSEG